MAMTCGLVRSAAEGSTTAETRNAPVSSGRRGGVPYLERQQQSVSAKFVALGIAQDHAVGAVLFDWPDDGRTEPHEPLDVGVDARLALEERRLRAATDSEVEMHAVLDDFRLRDLLKVE